MDSASFNLPPLREAVLLSGFGIRYAIRTFRAWWYCAWLRTLARFSRTYLGSLWLGLSNLISVSLLAIVYGTVFKIPNPFQYAVYLGIGLTIWTYLSQVVAAGCSLFTTPARRDQLINYSLPALFYCLEEWAFQLQTFLQSLLVVLLAASFIQPTLAVHMITVGLLPLLNLFISCFWLIILTSLVAARFKDIGQIVPLIMQLLFLVSPILYKRQGLGDLQFLAEWNPFFQILEPVRASMIDGTVSLGSQLLTFILNAILAISACFVLKRMRYRLPFWV